MLAAGALLDGLAPALASESEDAVSLDAADVFQEPEGAEPAGPADPEGEPAVPAESVESVEKAEQEKEPVGADDEATGGESEADLAEAGPEEADEGAIAEQAEERSTVNEAEPFETPEVEPRAVGNTFNFGKRKYKVTREAPSTSVMGGVQLGDGTNVCGTGDAVAGNVVIPRSVNRSFNGAAGQGIYNYFVESVGPKAFRDCTGLSSIGFGNAKGSEIVSIGAEAFAGCTGLTSIVIPEGVTTIGMGAFKGCTNLESVTLPSTLTLIEEEAFKDCASLSSIVIPEGVDEIGLGAFAGCTNLASVGLPSSLQALGSSAFEGCKSLTKVAVPDNLNRLNDRTFFDCFSLRTVEISPTSSLRGIGSDAFHLTLVTSIFIPKSVRTVDEAFANDAQQMTAINVDPDNSEYRSIDGVLFRKNMTELVRYPQAKGTTARIDDARTFTLGRYAFFNCLNVNRIVSYAYVENIDFTSGASSSQLVNDCFYGMNKAAVRVDLCGGTVNGADYTTRSSVWKGWGFNAYLMTQTVKFNTQGGSAVADQKLGIYDKVTKPTDPIRKGYVFKGWYKEPAGTTAWNFDNDTVGAYDLTLYAKWERATYTASFDSRGGSAVSSQRVPYEGLVSEPAAPTREGYAFGGWYKDAACSEGQGPWDFATWQMTAYDLTLYAKWTPIKYKVTYWLDGGTGTRPWDQTVSYEQEFELRWPISEGQWSVSRKGYTFGGWRTVRNADASPSNPGKSYAAGQKVKSLSSVDGSEVQLFPIWKPNPYTVGFSGNGATAGVAPANFSAVYDGDVPMPVNPFTRKGHTFKGWNTKMDGTGTTYEAGKTASRPNLAGTDLNWAMLYAKWERATYTASFDSRGGSAVSSQRVPYEGLVSEPAAPTREGYAFGGWYKDAACSEGQGPWDFATWQMTAYDLTLYAKWTPIVSVEAPLTAAIKLKADGTAEDVEASFTSKSKVPVGIVSADCASVVGEAGTAALFPDPSQWGDIDVTLAADTVAARAAIPLDGPPLKLNGFVIPAASASADGRLVVRFGLSLEEGIVVAAYLPEMPNTPVARVEFTYGIADEERK
ncbi:InlB B-repeat-containing protein [Eggerthella timonensis]|uniref:InlB B-repeat-containing protein n=1 Tax=Eggerthella timonensis TaxID=1871008 RepID=UPI0015E108AD|nr:InlB B-repeat-containing protein [Eggerthella timonensis]